MVDEVFLLHQQAINCFSPLSCSLARHDISIFPCNFGSFSREDWVANYSQRIFAFKPLCAFASDWCGQRFDCAWAHSRLYKKSKWRFAKGQAFRNVHFEDMQKQNSISGWLQGHSCTPLSQTIIPDYFSALCSLIRSIQLVTHQAELCQHRVANSAQQTDVIQAKRSIVWQDIENEIKEKVNWGHKTDIIVSMQGFI